MRPSRLSAPNNTTKAATEARATQPTAASTAITIGLVGFAFASLFLSAQYEKTLWLFLALIVVLKNLAYEGEAFRPDLRKLKRALARRQRRLEA